MTRRVVDSNVAVVANGRGTNAHPVCRLAAIEALNDLLRHGRIVVDRAGTMSAEYRRHCNPRGQPGVGDQFFREVLMNYAPDRVERIHLAQRNDGSFADFPDDPDLTTFDPSDRKFAAAARKTGVPVMNATDSDWLNHRAALSRNGITVEFLCGMERDTWYEADRKRGKRTAQRKPSRANRAPAGGNQPP